MADQELWELAVTVPPVTETVHKLLVKCGHTTVVAEPWGDGWLAVQGSAVTKKRPDYALEQELNKALDRELSQDGEPRG